MPSPPAGPVPARITLRTNRGWFVRDQKGDHAAHREPEQVDLFEAEGPDERDRVGRHRLDRVRRLSRRGAESAVVIARCWAAMPSTTCGSQSSSPAERLFYTEGIRAVGVDRLCAEAEVSKRSLYQHFTGKDEVVTAMLQAKAAELGSQLVTDGLSPRERILNVFAQADQAAEAPGACGCPFVSAATELKDREHPAVQVAQAQKHALTEYFAAALRDAGVRDADLLGLQLTLIFDGASAYAVVRGGSTPATRQAVETLLDAHGM
jgi:AcrR family transcriptional regulator